METLGHEVLGITDGSHAWLLYQDRAFDAAVIDWEMPELNGLELCRRMRGVPRAKYTYGIMLTSQRGKQDYPERMVAETDNPIISNVSASQPLAGHGSSRCRAGCVVTRRPARNASARASGTSASACTTCARIS